MTLLEPMTKLIMTANYVGIPCIKLTEAELRSLKELEMSRNQACLVSKHWDCTSGQAACLPGE
jgi:hypothetical protein